VRPDFSRVSSSALPPAGKLEQLLATPSRRKRAGARRSAHHRRDDPRNLAANAQQQVSFHSTAASKWRGHGPNKLAVGEHQRGRYPDVVAETQLNYIGETSGSRQIGRRAWRRRHRHVQLPSELTARIRADERPTRCTSISCEGDQRPVSTRRDTNSGAGCSHYAGANRRKSPTFAQREDRDAWCARVVGRNVRCTATCCRV